MMQMHRVSRLAARGAQLRAGAVRAFATDQASGPGLPPQGVQSEEEANKTIQRLYEGDKVEDAPQPKTFKPDQQQPSRESIDQGTGSERVQTPHSPGRPQDSSEPVGSPM